MRIGVAGPIDILDLRRWLPEHSSMRTGYAFPLTGQLAAAYRRAGHDIHVFAEDEQLHNVEHVSGDGVHVTVVPLRRARDRARDFFGEERRSLSDAMRAASCDVIHAHWTYEFALAGFASGTPTLVTAHDWAPAILRQYRDAYRLMRLGMQLATLRRARHLTAVSPYIAERLRRVAGVPIEVIPNGLDTTWGRGRSSLAPGNLLQPIVLAVNTGFERRKNVANLLMAFDIARKTVAESRLLLVGPDYGPNGPAHRWARQRRLESSVEFVGAKTQDEVKDLLSISALLVHPSLEESFGMTVLEAATSGVDVIAHQKAVGPAWILESSPECLVDCGDPRELADAIVDRLLADGEEIKQRTVALQRDVTHRFSLDETVSRYLARLSAVASSSA